LPIFYLRLVQSFRPTREDFLSHQARGIPARKMDARTADLNSGVSLLDTLEGAKQLQSRFPRLGAYAAMLAIPAGIRVERTSWEGHFTAWADPDDLLTWVVRVVMLP